MSAAFVTIVAVSVLVLLFLAGLLAMVLVRDLNRRNTAPPHSGTDLANMTILFHTMRDIVSQQKQLAAEFNKSLDRRVTEIKKVVDLVRQERELLRESRAQLNDLLHRAREIERTTQLPLTASARHSSPHSDPAPAASAVQPEEISVPEDDLIAHWTGIDFSEDSAESGPRHAPEPEPIPPEDAAAARDAFRTLLNLGGPQADVLNADVPGGNGRGHMNSLEHLVYEYSDAGMRVPEIARELGVGKGEVRLILSLRKKKGL